MPEMKRSIKDSVFTLMFREPKYALQLYQALHPEDRDVTEADCKIVTLENILTVGQYNDLGLLVRGRLLLLVEAQSIFTLNVVLRILLYLAETYKRYVDGQSLDLYGTRPVRIPRPELYVVYTGPRRDVPDMLHLSDLYFEGEGSAGLELEVKVCRASGTENILGQYVRFCKIADENRKNMGPPRGPLRRPCGSAARKVFWCCFWHHGKRRFGILWDCCSVRRGSGRSTSITWQRMRKRRAWRRASALWC